jgi:hypothetical protein
MIDILQGVVKMRKISSFVNSALMNVYYIANLEMRGKCIHSCIFFSIYHCILRLLSKYLIAIDNLMEFF